MAIFRLFLGLTRKKNDWAYRNFMQWRENHNIAFPDNHCPEDLIEKPPWDPPALAFWLARYACNFLRSNLNLTCVLVVVSQHLLIIFFFSAAKSNYCTFP